MQGLNTLVEQYRVNLFVDDAKNKKAVAVLESSYNDHFRIEMLDVDEFIRKNPSTKEITNPIYLSNNIPTPDGLFSREIFGITSESRCGIYGYINLQDYFLHPLLYKKMCSIDKRLKALVHGTKYFRFENGEFIEDPNGKTGISFLRKHFKELKFNTTDSSKREEVINFINKYKDKAFTNKLLVIPAGLRDIHTEGNSRGVAQINKLYVSVLMSTQALKGTDDFGFNMFDSVKGKIQELILAIYDLLSGNNNSLIETEPGLSKKEGLILKSGMSATTTYGSRLVLTAPQLCVETVDDICVDTTHSEIPMHSLLGNFKQFVIFWVRRYFENEFAAGTHPHAKKDPKTGEVTVVYDKVKDPFIQFGDERIDEEIQRFNEGYSDRFSPITVEFENGDVSSLYFKGKNKADGTPDAGESPIIGRRLTWCDLFYMALVDVTKDKHILITRYPIDSAYSQFPTKIVVSSTIETEPIFYNDEFYAYYPKIREEDINSDTGSKFIDTLRISNLMLDAIGGDYDGDQASGKGVYTTEANEELSEYLNSRLNYIGFDMKCLRTPGKEAYQAIFNFTRYFENKAPTLTKSSDIKFITKPPKTIKK